MKNSSLFLATFFVLFFSASACALQAEYMYVSLSYGRGWGPWVCLSEHDYKGYGAYTLGGACFNYTDYSSQFNLSTAYQTWSYVPYRPCPFEDDAMYGLGCNYGDVNVTKCLGLGDIEFGKCVQQAAKDQGVAGKSSEGSIVPPAWGLSVRITIPEDWKLLDSAGHVVGDELCRGDTVKLDKGVMKGEYWNDGGHEDSPPIYWVDDAEQSFKDLLTFHEIAKIDYEEMLDHGGKPADGYIDPLLNASVYTMAVPLAEFGGPAYITGSLICGLKKKQGTPGLENGGVYIKENVEQSEMTFSTSYAVECWFFYYGGWGGWSTAGDHYLVYRVPTVIETTFNFPGQDTAEMKRMAGGYGIYWNDRIYLNSTEDLFRVGYINVTKTVKLVDRPKAGIDVGIPGTTEYSVGESNLLRILIKNTGAVEINIKDIASNSPHKLISCDSVTVKPGESAECLYSVTPRAGEGTKLEVDYSYKSCGRDELGYLSKTLINSIMIPPASAEQADGVDVHGACENAYFSCHPSTANLVIGYKCQKKKGGFYTPTDERGLIGYDLTRIPANKTILGARTILNASIISGTQNIEAYASEGKLTNAACEPTGDICSKPYCQECANAYEPAATILGTASINGPGTYSYDVTGALKKALANGEKTLAIQYRGPLNEWSDAGQSSCTTVDKWTGKETVVDTASSYLEVAYK